MQGVGSVPVLPQYIICPIVNASVGWLAALGLGASWVSGRAEKAEGWGSFRTSEVPLTELVVE
jgi:hypothetical protein